MLEGVTSAAKMKALDVTTSQSSSPKPKDTETAFVRQVFTSWQGDTPPQQAASLPSAQFPEPLEPVRSSVAVRPTVSEGVDSEDETEREREGLEEIRREASIIKENPHFDPTASETFTPAAKVKVYPIPKAPLPIAWGPDFNVFAAFPAKKRECVGTVAGVPRAASAMALPLVVDSAMSDLGLYQSLRVTRGQMWYLVCTLQGAYSSENPYHNSTHGTDVNPYHNSTHATDGT
ncbi:LOW QUALITY PROTEIN: hypothetical protein KIPB_011344, partial [Kipferlia bialata]